VRPTVSLFLLYLLLGKSVKSLFKLLPEPKGRIVLHSMNMSFLNVQGNSSPIFWNAIDEVEIFLNRRYLGMMTAMTQVPLTFALDYR